MHYFNQIQDIEVSEDVIAKAMSFARKVTPTVGTPGRGYRDAQQYDLKKIQHDNFVSKIGEEAVKIVFARLGRQVQGPDYEVYEGQGKSWLSDLFINGVGLAVKTQTTSLAKRFGLSWTFQAGEYRRDPILKNPEAWVCFVEFDEERRMCRVYPPYQICELTFGEPKLDRLKGSKLVVYAQSLPAPSAA